MTSPSELIPLAISMVAAATLVSGCSGTSVDASCDVEGVTHEVEHILDEAQLTVDSFDTLQCSGDWAVAQVAVSGTDTAPAQQTIVFQQSEFGWILKTPEIACVAEEGLESIPDELRALACSAQ